MNDLWDYTSLEEGDNAYHLWTDAQLLTACAAGNESAADHLQDRGITLPSSRATRTSDDGPDGETWGEYIRRRDKQQ